MLVEIKKWEIALDDINNRIIHCEYEFIDPLDFINLAVEDCKSGMQVYWREMLQWLHLASVTTLMRNQKWIKGIVFGIESSNYIIFASSLRGYFEAFVDSYYSTNCKFIDIFENFININKALKGDMDRLFLNKEFEESLIHFYSASKNTNSKDYNVDWLNPLSIREYIKAFDLPGDELKHELYSELCEITHPASPSVKCFTTEKISKTIKICTNSVRDSILIKEMLVKYSNLLNLVFRLSNIIPILNLRVLNYFNEPCISANFIKDSIINNICVNEKEWNSLEDIMN